MFGLKENEVVGFDSRWKIKKVTMEGGTQTIADQPNNVGTSTSISNEIETQTDAEEPKTAQYDEGKLAEWLKKIYPSVKRELDDTISSQAFNNYQPMMEEVDANAKLTKKIKLNNEAGDNVLPVSALSWNCTGNTIATACNHEHTTWCHHTEAVRLFTFDRFDLMPDIPQKIIYTQNCITSLRFHPNIPFLIVGGSYSGEIIVWNIQNEDNDVLVRVNGHEEALTQISWITALDAAKSLLLATSSLDGYLCLWNFSASTPSMQIKERYKIKPPMFAKMARKTETVTHLSRKIDRGILAFDFSKFVPDMFIVAAEGGLVVQCSMLGTKPLKDSTKECPISDPVFKYYSIHEGEISSIHFSPNRRELFLTNGSEGEIRIYVIGQEEPAQVIFLDNPLQSVSWVPYQEKLIAACGTKGFIEIFDVIKGKLIHNVTNEDVDPCVLTQMDINSKRISVVAVGTREGELQLWTIPWNLFSLKV